MKYINNSNNKINNSEKKKINNSINDLTKALDSGNIEEIEEKKTLLMQSASIIIEEMDKERKHEKMRNDAYAVFNSLVKTIQVFGEKTNTVKNKQVDKIITDIKEAFGDDDIEKAKEKTEQLKQTFEQLKQAYDKILEERLEEKRLLQAIQQAQEMLNKSKKIILDYGKKIYPYDKVKIEEAAIDLEKALQVNKTDIIKEKTEILKRESDKISDEYIKERKFVEVCNNANNVISTCEKKLQDRNIKINVFKKMKIKKVISDLKKAINARDIEKIYFCLNNILIKEMS